MGDAKRPVFELAIVRIASRLVPRSARKAWILEWQGELVAHVQDLEIRGALTLRARGHLLLRAGGCLVDALLYRDGRWTMNGFLHDVRIAARGLARRPGFSMVIVATLAVGIGSTTSIFSVARDVLLRPFPYPEPDRVVAVQGFDLDMQGFSGNVTYPNVFDLDAAATSFDGIGAARYWVPALEDERGSVVVRGATVTANYFDILGVEAGQGRFFRADEEGPGREPLVVISHSLWVDRFGADPTLVGRDIHLSGAAYRVIGIASRDYEDPWLMGGPGPSPSFGARLRVPPPSGPDRDGAGRGSPVSAPTCRMLSLKTSSTRSSRGSSRSIRATTEIVGCGSHRFWS